MEWNGRAETWDRESHSQCREKPASP